MGGTAVCPAIVQRTEHSQTKEQDEFQSSRRNQVKGVSVAFLFSASRPCVPFLVSCNSIQNMQEGDPSAYARQFVTFEQSDLDNPGLLRAGSKVMVWRHDSTDRARDGGKHCEAVILEKIDKKAVSSENATVPEESDQHFRVRYDIDKSEYVVKGKP